jgi:hypothetical protein
MVSGLPAVRPKNLGSVPGKARHFPFLSVSTPDLPNNAVRDSEGIVHHHYRLPEFLGSMETRLPAMRPRNLGFVPCKARDVSFPLSFHIGNWAQPVSYTASTGDSFPGGKAAKA